MKNLFLVVTKEWYDKIASGEKRVEYRENTPYWNKRFGVYRDYATIEFQCGYSRKYPRLKFEVEKINFIPTPINVQNIIKTIVCFAIYFK